jgi:hypothetical protein
MSLFPRTVAFIILVVAVNQWLKHHLGVEGVEGVVNDFLSVVFMVASGVTAFLDKRLDKLERGSLAKKVSQTFSKIISVPVLACLYLIVIFVGLSYSSVSVIGNFDDKTTIEIWPVGSLKDSPNEASIAPGEDTSTIKGGAAGSAVDSPDEDSIAADEDTHTVKAMSFGCLKDSPNKDSIATGEDTKTAKGGAAGSTVDSSNKGFIAPGEGDKRFGVWTNIFGRHYRLKVDGFVEEVVTVYPIVGRKVVVDRDLRRSPSVLFWPSPNGLRELGDGACIFIWKVPPGREPPFEAPTGKKLPFGDEHKLAEDEGYEGSFILGRIQPVPESLLHYWQLKLTGDEEGLSGKVISGILSHWLRPRVLTPLKELVPGMTIYAVIINKKGETIAKATVKLGTDKLMDAQMTLEGRQ